MKVAVISDIHGNMQALEAVLADIKQEECDKIFCLGDLAMAGPEPTETIKCIKALFDAGTLDLIQGNTDEMIANFADFAEKVKEAFPVMGNALESDVAIIPDNLKNFLKDLPKQKEIEIDSVKVLLVHGSPRKNDENIFPNLSIAEVEEMVDGTDVNLILCGHTHMPCGYQTTNNQTIVNVGSVGRPFTEDSQSCYVIARFNEGVLDVMHKFVEYDKQKASEILSKREFVGADKLAKVLIKPENRHM